jgi:hypothetical protein
MAGWFLVVFLPGVDLVLITCSILLAAADIPGTPRRSGETGLFTQESIQNPG